MFTERLIRKNRKLMSDYRSGDVQEKGAVRKWLLQNRDVDTAVGHGQQFGL